MIGRLRAQAGFTMVEVLVAMSLSVFVLGVTLTAFESLLDEDRAVTRHNEAQEESRQAVDRLARHLRNLASPTALTLLSENRPRAVEAAGPWNLVARIVDDQPKAAGSLNRSNVMRVRWCLNTSNPGNGTLWFQTQRWTTAAPPALPATGTCPAAGWGSQVRMAGNIVNAVDPLAPRALFSYDSADLEKVTRIHTDVYVDPNPGASPVEARVSSGVILRNQNQYPTAAFTITASAGTFRFDGSASTDPESQPLRYCWFVNPPTPTPDCQLEDPAWTPPPSFKGEGVVLNPGGMSTSSAYRVVLVVEDPSGLSDEEAKTWP